MTIACDFEILTAMLLFKMNIFADYSNIISVGLIPMIIAVFALGLPLFLQIITRIDGKYHSTKLIQVFKREKATKLFVLSLLAAVISCVIWFLQFPPLFNWGWLIDNSAFIILAICTIFLVFSTFFIVYRTYTYYVPEKLVNHLIILHRNIKKVEIKNFIFEAISKILFYSINKADEKLARKLATFYTNTFSEIKKENRDNAIVYPQEYYDSIFEANELLCKRDRRTISLLNDAALFDLFLDTNMSDETYRFIWTCLVQTIQYNRGDIVFAYWRKAHQLFSLFMRKIQPNYDFSTFPPTVLNQTEIDEKEIGRSDFLEFHYLLGALLLYKQQYGVIKEIMRFTHTNPPTYVLVPERMEEVIEQYMKIEPIDNQQFISRRRKYWFPDISGVDSDAIVQMWLKRYFAVLFIRQYTLPSGFINRLKMPYLPEELSELKHWINELDGLKFFVNDYLKQEEVLKELGLEESLHEKDTTTPPPIELIENYQKTLEERYNTIKKKQPVSPKWEKVFEEKTKEILIPIFQKHESIFHNKNIGTKYQPYHITGQHYILPKTAFSDDQDIDYTNTSSITAKRVAQQFRYYFANTLVLILPRRYTLIGKDLFPAIDKLNINPNDFIIIAVGLYLDYYASLKIDGLKKRDGQWFFKNVRIAEMESSDEYVAGSLFILKKDDLPNIVFKEIDDQEHLDKFNLKKIDETFNIYAGLNDLNDSKKKELRNIIEANTTEKDLSQKVLACVDINVEIQCKKRTKCVQLKLFSQFDDRGKPDNVDEVESPWDDE